MIDPEQDRQPGPGQRAFRGSGDQAMRRHRVTPEAPAAAQEPAAAPSRGVQTSLFSQDEIRNPQGPGPSNFNMAQFRTSQRAIPGTPNPPHSRAQGPGPRLHEVEAPTHSPTDTHYAQQQLPVPDLTRATPTTAGQGPGRAIVMRSYDPSGTAGRSPSHIPGSLSPAGNWGPTVGAANRARHAQAANNPTPTPQSQPHQQQGPSPQNLNPIQQSPSRPSTGPGQTTRPAGPAGPQTGSWHSYDPTIGRAISGARSAGAAAARAVGSAASKTPKPTFRGTAATVELAGKLMRDVGKRSQVQPTVIPYNTTWRKR